MITVSQETTFDFLSEEYCALFSAADATAFQSPGWMSAFYKILAPARDAAPLVITFRRDEKLLGVAALIKRKKMGLTLVESADLGVTDYASPVLSEELLGELKADPNLQKQFLIAIDSHSLLRVRPCLPRHGEYWKLLLGSDPQELEFSSHAVELQQPMSDWRMQNMDKKLASMISRKGKRWKRQHEVVMERVVNPDEASSTISELAKLRSGRFEGDPIQDTEVEKFYCAVAKAGAGEGACEVWKVTSDGDLACIVFGLTHNGRFLYLLIGADYDGHGRHSPGLQMYDWIIEDWMMRGGTCFDFTIGDEPFKAQFGTSAQRMSILLRANGLVGKLAMKLFETRFKR